MLGILSLFILLVTASSVGLADDFLFADQLRTDLSRLRTTLESLSTARCNRPAPKGVAPSCKEALFSEASGMLPKYWAQNLITTERARQRIATDFNDQEVSVLISDQGGVNPALLGFEPSNPDYPKTENPEHGNQVAGLIMSPKAGILPVGAKTSVHYIDASADPVASLERVLAHNQRSANKIRTVNFSFEFVGQARRSEVAKLLEKIDVQNEVNVVWSAGNDGIDVGGSALSHPNLIPVSSVSPYQELSGFSNFGPSVAMSAPADVAMGSVGAESFGGTSGAAPLVTAALTAISKTNPTLNATTSRTILFHTARDFGTKGRDPIYGYGIPNIPLAMEVASRLGNSTHALPTPELVATIENLKKEIQQAELKKYIDPNGARSCEQFKALHDELLHQYFLTGGDPTISVRLCDIYFANGIASGVEYFCSSPVRESYYEPARLSELVYRVTSETSRSETLLLFFRLAHSKPFPTKNSLISKLLKTISSDLQRSNDLFNVIRSVNNPRLPPDISSRALASIAPVLYAASPANVQLVLSEFIKSRITEYSETQLESVLGTLLVLDPSPSAIWRTVLFSELKTPGERASTRTRILRRAKERLKKREAN